MLEGDTTRIAVQLAIAPNEAVTGNHDSERIATIGMPHRTGCLRHPQTLGEFPIGQRRTKRYALEFLSDALLKWCPWWGEQ